MDHQGSEEKIVLPENTRLREAYIAILKTVFLNHQDEFWFHEIIDLVSLDCGVSPNTAEDKCKQLIRFQLLKYLYSSINGHRYLVLVFTKKGNAIYPVDNWEKFDQLIENQFSNMAETDIVKIRRSVNNLEITGLRGKKAEEVKSELERLQKASVIYDKSEDTLESKFIYKKQTTKEYCQELEKKKLFPEKNSSDSALTSENSLVLGR